AYHIASSEAVSLRNPTSRLWCKCLLERGVAATLGPVAEPYTIGFPKPAEFFGLLVTGKYTLVECYAKTALLTSWMTVLVGDPLSTPAPGPRKRAPGRVKQGRGGGMFLLKRNPKKPRPPLVGPGRRTGPGSARDGILSAVAEVVRLRGGRPNSHDFGYEDQDH